MDGLTMAIPAPLSAAEAADDPGRYMEPSESEEAATAPHSASERFVCTKLGNCDMTRSVCGRRHLLARKLVKDSSGYFDSEIENPEICAGCEIGAEHSGKPLSKSGPAWRWDDIHPGQVVGEWTLLADPKPFRYAGTSYIYVEFPDGYRTSIALNRIRRRAGLAMQRDRGGSESAPKAGKDFPVGTVVGPYRVESETTVNRSGSIWHYYVQVTDTRTGEARQMTLAGLRKVRRMERGGDA